jgi:glycosyltransferase involved in cell wall biosynthesis
MTPRVSIIIPNFNYADYLRTCLRSVLRQTFQDFEVIVVDSSTDNSPEVFREFNDPRLKYVRDEVCLGPAVAFNIGLSQSKGEFFAGIGADDAMLPDNLKIKITCLDRNPDIGLIHSNAYAIDESGRIIGAIAERKAMDSVSDEPVIAPTSFEKLLFANFIIASSAVVRRECLDKIGLFDSDLRHSEDWDMWLRLSWNYNFAYIDKPLVLHRLHRKSLRVQNTFDNTDMDAVQRILKKTFRAFSLESQGYSFEKLYSTHYFNLLNVRFGLLPNRQILKLYIEGLRGYPGYFLCRDNIRFLSNLVAFSILPKRILASLRELKYRRRLRPKS